MARPTLNAIDLEKSRLRRFWKYIIKTDTCWLWNGLLSTAGYGQLAGGGRYGGHLLAHRFSWELHNGSIPDGLCVLHACDVRACVNPAHLFLGTKKDNTRDMMNKKRDGVTGEKNCHAKLKEEEVLEIRRLFNQRGKSRKALSDAFLISRSQIERIINHQSWKTLP